ncbi:MAG TPA: ribonuclease D [Acidimicrobiales bacterium]|nr:ribonuclease D [Acidimicrobiales bacterium]
MPAGDAHRLVVDDRGLDEVVDALDGVEAYAVDTEFHRERTYFPKVALVQIAWPGGCALIDPLAVDIEPLADVFEGPGLAVMHACTQDLEVFQRACGTVPSRLFDTQLASGFLGFSTPSLSAIVDRVLDVHLPKGNRLTDWLRRPLSGDQLTYAASDVLHLLELADILRRELEATGRLDWAEEECEELRSRGWGPPEPDAAWLRLKESRSLRGTARGVAQAVAAWRERRAAAVDQPPRFVLPDLAVIGIANNPPRDPAQLRKVRGLDERHAKGRTGEELLEAVRAGTELDASELRRPKRDEVDRDLRPAVALVSAWISQISRELRIDTTLLATRSDLSAFLADDPDARLATGWRGELLGAPIRSLVGGEFALAFDGKGGLALERRSGKAVTIDLPVPEADWL